MGNWIVGGYREAMKQSVGYVQIDTPEHLGKVRVFEPDAEAIAAQIVREHNAHGKLLEAVTLWDKFFETMPKGQFGKIACDVGVMNKAFIATRAALRLAQEK